jgi:NOL1/NOP2/fmu family ribosome biogenesis protein
MSQIKILSQREKQEILNQLHEQFGIKEIPLTLLKRGEEKIFAFSGEINEEQINSLAEATPIEGMGIYFAKLEPKLNLIRLSIEGVHLIQKQITKNIFELKTQEQVDQWMSGQELPIQVKERGFIVIKYKNDFLGTGKASEMKIGNFIPKNRRLKLKE